MWKEGQREASEYNRMQRTNDYSQFHNVLLYYSVNRMHATINIRRFNDESYLWLSLIPFKRIEKKISSLAFSLHL